MDTYFLLILLALFGFLALAVVVLLPFYLFLQREKRASQQWTPEALGRRLGEAPASSDPAPQHDTVEDQYRRIH